MSGSEEKMQVQQVIGWFVVLEKKGVSKFAGEKYMFPAEKSTHLCKGGIFVV